MSLRNEYGAVVVHEAAGDGHEPLAIVVRQSFVQLRGNVELPHVLRFLNLQHDV